MTDAVELAYSQRASEYIELLGSMSTMHPSDRQLAATWADGIDGEAIDAGCGPGHWTDFLRERGLTARGIDRVSEFVDSARATFPRCTFHLDDIDALNIRAGSVGGVFAWYSLIHHEPDAIHVPLREFHRVLRPGGTLLVGFFEGVAVERFEHAIAPAYRWPVAAFSDVLRTAGFDVIETHTRATTDQRPHAAIHARRAELAVSPRQAAHVAR